jgi:hypothetical protein
MYSKEPQLFDHRVGEREQLIGNIKAYRLRGFDIQDQLELGRLFNRHRPVLPLLLSCQRIRLLVGRWRENPARRTPSNPHL